MEVNRFHRITHNANVMGGRACIRGMRVTVGMIVGQINAGVTVDEMLEDYPYLERADIEEALIYPEERFPCPCCGEREILKPGSQQICPACDWQDNLLQTQDPDLARGANELSLNQARQRYKNMGTSNPKVKVITLE